MIVDVHLHYIPKNSSRVRALNKPAWPYNDPVLNSPSTTSSIKSMFN